MLDPQTARERMVAASDEWYRRHRMDEYGQVGVTGRIAAVQGLLTSLEQNDAQYLAGEIERDKWLEISKGIDDRLAVAGLRLAARPWERR